MVTYDPKRSRPVVDVDHDEPAPVERLVELPVVEADREPDADVDLPADLPADLPDEATPGEPEHQAALSSPMAVNAEVSPSPFEPAGPPDQRLGKAIAVGVATAGALALMVAWRRRRR